MLHLEDLAIIWKQHTNSDLMNLSIQICHEPSKDELFEGTIKEFLERIHFGTLKRLWQVCEITRIPDEETPIYNRPLFITVT